MGNKELPEMYARLKSKLKKKNEKGKINHGVSRSFKGEEEGKVS